MPGELETALQHRSSALLARLPTARARGLHFRAPGFAIRTSYARRALAGAKTNPKLTSQPDHSIGAGHLGTGTMGLIVNATLGAIVLLLVSSSSDPEQRMGCRAGGGYGFRRRRW